MQNNLIISRETIEHLHQILESVNPEEMANTEAFKIADALNRLEFILENNPSTCKPIKLKSHITREIKFKNA